MSVDGGLNSRRDARVKGPDVGQELKIWQLLRATRRHVFADDTATRPDPAGDAPETCESVVLKPDQQIRPRQAQVERTRVDAFDDPAILRNNGREAFEVE